MSGKSPQEQGQPVGEGEARLAEGELILPGFVDLPVHGGGFDPMEGGAAVTEIARIHARHGTTSMLATTMTAPMADIRPRSTASRRAPTSPCSTPACN
jgi:N-acetylglucosamine-6-phosphate deacetylase